MVEPGDPFERGQFDRLLGVPRCAATTKRAAGKILERARITQVTLVEQIEAIGAEIVKLKENAADYPCSPDFLFMNGTGDGAGQST